jgi:CRP-like cAMP-binding protein
MLTILEKADLLMNVEIFREVRTQSLARVAAIAEEVSCGAHQRLYNENEPPDFLFVLLEGEVVLSGHGRAERRLTRFHIPGALAVLANKPHAETAIASRPGRALCIGQQALFDAMAEDFNITRGILRALVTIASSRGWIAAPGTSGIMEIRK